MFEEATGIRNKISYVCCIGRFVYNQRLRYLR